MINVNLLREKVISAAVLGKLSANCISKTSAKDDLVKLGIKIDDLSDENIPCAIKTGWEWVRVSNLGADKYSFADGPFGSNLKKEHYTDEKQVRIIQLSNVGELGWKNENEKYTTYEHLETIKRSEVFPGNIVIAKMMPAGRAIIVPDVSDAYVLSSDCVRFVPNSGLNTKYLCYAINSKMFRTQVLQDVHGIGRERTSLSKLKSYLLPIPPIDEQQIIVDRINYIFDLISQIDALQQRYESDREILKGKVIDAGIRGMLTEQLPEDGNAEDLYTQIQKEKAILVKEGKIKKEKPLPKISDEEIPFEIPKTWKWVRLGELAKLITKGSSPKWQGITYTDETKGILFITSENIGNGILLIDKKKYVEKEFNKMHPTSILLNGDLLTNIVGASIGRTAIFNLNESEANINQAVCIIRLMDLRMAEYLLRYLCSEWAISLMIGKVVDTARANLSLTSVANLLIPLPPLNEQYRITNVIGELFNFIA